MISSAAYLGNIGSGSLMVKEGRLIAALLLKKPSKAQWRSAIVDDNLLQKQSSLTANTVAGTLRKRFEPMGDAFLQKLVVADTETVEQYLFAAILINSPMLQEFMTKVVKDARRLYRHELTATDWEEFWDAQSSLHAGLTKLSDTTKTRIRQNVFKILADVKHIESTASKRLWGGYVNVEVQAFLESLGRADVASNVASQKAY